jgi:hypothetical protein
MADEKQLNAIRYFCQTPYSDHGLKRAAGKGHDYHDWGDLIQQISYFDFGHVQKDKATLQIIARLMSKEFPNGDDWNKITSAPGSHERILSIIRTGLASQLALNGAAA